MRPFKAPSNPNRSLNRNRNRASNLSSPRPSRRYLLPLLLASGLSLSGCVASLAASALGSAMDSARGEPRSNEHLKPEASQACSSHAARYGTVHVIDVEQRTISKIVVWGTVDDGTRKRSFECAFATEVTGFKLREIGR